MKDQSVKGKNMDRPSIPYGRQIVDEDDIQEVVAVLRSDWLTTGPMVAQFETCLSRFLGTRYAIAVSSGTAALHCAMHAIGIGPGDEVIVPTLTFAATANCILYQGGVPVFADIAPDTLLLDPEQVEKKITPRTKAIIAVEYAGHPCDYSRLQEIARQHRIPLVADACHALGAKYKGKYVGTLADLTCFSFHPVKHITTGEGGMVVTNDAVLAERVRTFRNHGFSTDHRQRFEHGHLYSQMHTLGFNYRLSDIQCALGLSQMKKLPQWLERRRCIAARYECGLEHIQGIKAIARTPEIEHAYHLFVIRIDDDIEIGRDDLLTDLKGRGILANFHYHPVHLHPFYQNKFKGRLGSLPVAENIAQKIISLPMHAALDDADVDYILFSLRELMEVQR